MSSNAPSSPLTILAIDATLRRCSAALWKNDRVVAQVAENTPNHQAARLVPITEQLLTENNTQYNDLSAIACTIGPGSFTGIRIGLATAKAIALATNLPLMGVTTLETIAWQASKQAKAGDKITAAINAYRGEIYLQTFTCSGASIQPATAPQALTLEEAISAIPRDSVIVGDAQPLIVEKFGSLTPCPDVTHPSACYVAEFAAHEKRFASSNSVIPFYIRPPDAKLPTT